MKNFIKFINEILNDIYTKVPNHKRDSKFV